MHIAVSTIIFSVLAVFAAISLVIAAIRYRRLIRGGKVRK